MKQDHAPQVCTNPIDWARLKPLTTLLFLTFTVQLCGCRSIGPGSIPRDRYDYSGSISESWKRQTLLNIVKLRYFDPPIFVDVAQIVAGYSLESGLTAGATLPENNSLGGATATVGGSARFTDRPTITYTPLTGNKFVKALMTPLPPESVFFTIQSGWPADAIFFTSVASINGLKNQEASISGLTMAEPQFLRVLQLLRQLQLSGAVGMRIYPETNRNRTVLATLRVKNMPAETLAQSQELRRLLGLSLEATEFRLVFGSLAADEREIALQTRSLIHIMALMAAQVQVPEAHILEGRAAPGLRQAEKREEDGARIATIQSGTRKPEDIYVAVQYRDHWFWISDRDLRSKRAFAFMMLLFTLSETGESEPLPLITIPAQ